MDLKARMDEIAQKLKADESLKSQFESDPAATVKFLLDTEVPDSTVKLIVDSVKSRITERSDSSQQATNWSLRWPV